MADAAVLFLLESLSDLLRGQTYDGEDELLKLKEELSLSTSFLEKGASMIQAERLKDLKRQLKELLYDVEDAIESSSIKLAAVNARPICFSPYLIRQLGAARKTAIQSIRYGKLDSITRTIRAYGDPPIAEAEAEAHTAETNQVHSEQLNKEAAPSIGPKKIIIGFEDEAVTLISLLLEKTEEVDVIAITGMPGIGKTTLASKIYQDYRIQQEFPTHIWIDNITPEFRSRDLCLSILKQQGIEYQNSDIPQPSEILGESSQTEEDVLNPAVFTYLRGKRYLLVIDGVWDADSLSSFVKMLPEKGKVLITSRNNNMNTKHNHVVPFLNEKESWELLQLEVFGELDKCPDALKPAGKLIAKNCDGSPLAIVAAASSLVVTSSTEAAKALTKKWWEAVSQNVTTYLTDSGEHLVFSSVELSYTTLPQQLQECFLYLVVFPLGYEIPVRTLVRLWIAEGLVRYYQGEVLEETSEHILEESAKQILDTFVDRNLIMVDKTYPNGQIKTCRLHKLIYGFCKYKAAELGFYQEIKMLDSSDRPISLTPGCRRLSIQSNLSKFLSRTDKEQRIRSILCLNREDKVVLHSEDRSTIRRHFKFLRVLECSHIKFTKFPGKLRKLMHLRYISLSCDDIREIPEEISSITYLETLVVNTRSTSINLKANLWRMLKLRHLVTKAAITLAIQGEGEAGKNLQTLTRLAPTCCTENFVTRAPNLKTLGIRGKLAALSSPECLRSLHRLEKLKLINESASEFQLNPECFPPNLKSLTISATNLQWECMSILGKIDTLEILKLKNSAFIGESWTSTGADGFRRLIFLSIETTDLVSWEASDDCFPTLKCLVLKNCENLQKIPSSLAEYLDKLDVENVPESAEESIWEIKQK